MEQIVTAAPRVPETCNLVRTNLLMNLDQKPKTRSTWLTLRGF